MHWLHKGLPAFGAGVLIGLAGMLSPVAQLAASATQSTDGTVDRPTVAGPVQASARMMLPGGERLELDSDGARLVLHAGTPDSAARAWPLAAAHRGATLTRIADGRILLWGGADGQGRALRRGYWFDPELRDLRAAEPAGLSARAFHTGTLLTDGRVLFAGGQGGAQPYQLWDPATGAVQEWDADERPAPGHKAVLQPDGRVRLFGGQPGASALGRALLFDPQSRRMEAAPATGPPAQHASVTGSLPVQGGEMEAGARAIAVRLGTPVGMDALSGGQAVLFGPGGTTAVKVVVAEGGRLAYVKPVQPLFPGGRYTLMIDGVRSLRGQILPLFVLDFTAAAHGEPARPSAPDADGAAPQRVSAGNGVAACVRTIPCQEAATLQQGRWTPGRDSLGQNWRVPGRQPDWKRVGIMPQLFAAWRMTALSGRILRTDGQPMAGVSITLDHLVATTDTEGRFLLHGVPAGRQVLHVDGSTANSGAMEYGQFAVGVDVSDGILNEIPFTLWLPRISARDKIRIPSPTVQDMVLTHPDLPGMELHLPAGTVIRDQKGNIVTEIAIVPTPVNRSPYPLPADFPMYFTLQPGGAVLQGLTPAAGRGARVIYPNYDRWPAGTAANFWLYDPHEGWKVYGQGRVGNDERQFIPEPGVALREVVAFGASVEPVDPAPETGMPPDPQECGDGNGGSGCNATAGDPVDLKTGRFTYAETDLVIKDVVPVSFGRNYRPSDRVKREFGFGTAASFSYRISTTDTTRNTLQLVLPNGAAIDFQRTSGSGSYGTWAHASGGDYAGATLATNIDSGYHYLLVMRDGARMRFESYAPNGLVWHQDRYGNRTTYVRDAGKVVQIQSSSGRVLNLDYDVQGRIATATDALGHVWRYSYTADGLLGSVVHPDLSERRYVYQHWGNGATLRHRLQAVFDQRGNRLLLNEHETSIGATGQEETSGRVIRQTLADGAVYLFQYDHAAGGTVGTLVTLPDGSQRRVVFGSSGYPASDTLGYGTPLAQTYLFERDAQQRLTARTDALGRRTEFTYNAQGLPTSLVELAGTPQAVTALTGYDEQGNITSRTDPLGNVTLYHYQQGCLVGQSDPLGNTTVSTCTASGLPASTVDPTGAMMRYRYIQSDLAEVIDGAGRSQQMRHDAVGRLIGLQDPEGNLLRQEYDWAGRLVREVLPDGGVTERGYDANGNLAALLMPHGAGQLFEYNVRNGLTRRTDSLGQSESWSYDGVGRITAFTDRRGNVTTYQHDVLGRLTGVQFADGNTLTAEFDAGNRLVRVIDSASGELSWTYDGLDRMLSETSPQGTVHFAYDAAGRRTGLQAIGQGAIQYDYDAADRLTAITQDGLATTLGYDGAGRIIGIRLPSGVEGAFAYNAQGLATGIAWQRPGQPALATAGFAYDANGRVVAQTGSWANGPHPEVSAGNMFDDNARQTQARGQPQAHDANGNLTMASGRTYLWDARNRLTGIAEDGVSIATYAYDALGRRIMRREQGVEIHYQYSGNDVIAESSAGSSVPVLSLPDAGWMLARGQGAAKRWYLTDSLRSTRGLLDAAGNLLQHFSYDPYGNSADIPSPAAMENPYLYAGKERDHSGLYYMRARYYDPDAARFISEDPLLFVDGPNPYAYAGNDPLNLVDADGRQAVRPPPPRPPRGGNPGYNAGGLRAHQPPPPRPNAQRWSVRQPGYDRMTAAQEIVTGGTWREGHQWWPDTSYPDLGKRPPPCSLQICGPGITPNTPPSCPQFKAGMSGPDGPPVGCRCL